MRQLARVILQLKQKLKPVWRLTVIQWQEVGIKVFSSQVLN